MKQTTFSIPLDVRPQSAARLSALIEEFNYREDKLLASGGENYSRVHTQLPMLHFMSMSVFEDDAYDPIFIIEANFDGPEADFWTALDRLAGDMLRDMLRCCKAPLDDDADLYHAVTRAGATGAVSIYLRARVQRPSVYHHGNRGLPRDQILKDAKLFQDIREELDAPENQGPAPYRGASPQEFHKKLRARFVNDHAWLRDPAPDRFPLMQRLGDFWRLLSFMTMVLFALSLPGILAAMLLDRSLYLTLLVVLVLLVGLGIFALRKPLPGTEVKTRFNVFTLLWQQLPTVALVVVPPVVALVLGGILFMTIFDALFGVLPGGPCDWWWRVTGTILLGLLSLLLIVPALVLWLRFLEKRDSSQYAPPLDAAKIADMAKNEDWVSQNHMGSIVHIRPGVLRTIIIKAGHLGLGRLLRVKATAGYLGSMRTVHYAHWAFLNNGSRLLFFSNFDQSWGSYLDDFIEKAHSGLTLAWGCGVGFPPTRFLIYDGASHGRLFKTWALASRTTSRFWYSAYPNLSVDQIERNHRVANGLRAAALEDDAARNWMRDL